MNTRGELAGCRPDHPHLEAERQAGDSQSQKARGSLGPRDGILHQTVSRLPVGNQAFLGFGAVDIHQETHSTPETVLSWHTQKPSGRDQGGDKPHRAPGTVHSSNT